MSSARRTLAAVAITALVAKTTSFTPQSTNSVRGDVSLNVMPPMIIGPMIRKMREEQQKKKMPMATAEEAMGQAPGLRVGGNAWKWPPVWPYEQNFFTPPEDIPKPDASAQLNNMAGMLSGVNKLPTPDEIELKDQPVLDVMKYWGEEKAEVKTEMDEEAIEKLKGHFSYYLKPGMSILEFGAAETSYLPENIKPSRHVGVSLSSKLMDLNPSLTEKLIVDLNKVVVDKDVDSDELRALAVEPFDAIIMTNTIDFLTHPREVFRSAWQLLKPGGIMLVAFSTKKAYASKFERAQTKMWRDFNDDQHMWITGSFFQFSAGDGWEKLLGFDISPESAKDSLASGPLSMLQQGKDNNVYVVQASKGYQDEAISEETPMKSIDSKMWMLPTLESRDKKLVVPRLARVFSKTKNQATKNAIAKNIPVLPKIYEVLTKMDQFAFTFQMQSQLAADLVINPDFEGNDEQMIALRQGLGLRTPSAEFWKPVGENTLNMPILDKINLLAYLVPRFGSGSQEQEDALMAFATGLKPTIKLVKEKCPSLDAGDIEIVATELLCAEILIPGRSTKGEFVAWLDSMTESELKQILADRKQANKEAQSELGAYRAKLAEEERKREELRKKYQEQLEKARKERSMAFNPATGKFQKIKNDKKD